MLVYFQDADEPLDIPDLEISDEISAFITDKIVNRAIDGRDGLDYEAMDQVWCFCVDKIEDLNPLRAVAHNHIPFINTDQLRQLVSDLENEVNEEFSDLFPPFVLDEPTDEDAQSIISALETVASDGEASRQAMSSEK